MALQIRAEIKRISLLLIMAGMIAGLASPSSCDEFYNSLLKLNGHSYEISNIQPEVVYDCITSDQTASHNQHQQIASRSRISRTDLFRFSGSDLFNSSSVFLLNRPASVLLIAAVCAAAFSYYHIIFIHLKDGHK